MLHSGLLFLHLHAKDHFAKDPFAFALAPFFWLLNNKPAPNISITIKIRKKIWTVCCPLSNFLKADEI